VFNKQQLVVDASQLPIRYEVALKCKSFGVGHYSEPVDLKSSAHMTTCGSILLKLV
jgi:hypothetical protein